MKLLVDKKYTLEKFPGKGGWTFARIPEVPQDKKSPFGWVKVHVIIDGYEIKNYRLMPMGDGALFLPVRADIRKKIAKQEGDVVRVILYADDGPLHIPEVLSLCLKDEPVAQAFFESLSEEDKSSYVEWINAAKSDEEIVKRLAWTIDELIQKKRMK